MSTKNNAVIFNTAKDAVIRWGNPSDTSGYEKGEGKVLGYKTNPFGLKIFLVQKGNKLGLATVTDDNTYYCTNARLVGSYGGGVKWDFENSIQSLGFGDSLQEIQKIAAI